MALGFTMQRYQRSTDLLDDAAAEYLGVNRTDLRCLDSLSDGPKTAGQLTEAVALSSAATTTLLDRLERKGLVQRIRDTTDRRRVLVELTARGQTLVQQLYEPLMIEGSTLLERYSDDELTLLCDFVELCADLNHRHRARIQQRIRQERTRR
jgi:DNA-binding MarR family transcriptional regulator